MTPEQMARLRELAEAATTGPWTWNENLGRNDMPELYAPEGKVCDFGSDTQYYPTEGRPPSDEDAAYIADAHPQAVLALLDAITTLQQEKAALAHASIALRVRAEQAERERDAWMREWERKRDRLEAVQAENRRLHAALVKVRAHTSYINPTLELLAGLLASIERIADGALAETDEDYPQCEQS